MAVALCKGSLEIKFADFSVTQASDPTGFFLDAQYQQRWISLGEQFLQRHARRDDVQVAQQVTYRDAGIP